MDQVAGRQFARTQPPPGSIPISTPRIAGDSSAPQVARRKSGASEVLVSQTVKDLVAGSGLSFEDAGEHEHKGVPDRWHLYRVRE
jgi:hypothetical protein